MTTAPVLPQRSHGKNVTMSMQGNTATTWGTSPGRFGGRNMGCKNTGVQDRAEKKNADQRADLAQTLSSAYRLFQSHRAASAISSDPAASTGRAAPEWCPA